MSKIYGLFGTMTGKLADVVMVVRNGQQIGRRYQPVVSNPSTPAQVESRARLKLMSQLAAVMAPVIAIAKEGPVSARNLFVKLNYRLATYASSIADIQLTDIKITKSVISLSPVLATTEGGQLSLRLQRAMPDIDRVVYCIFARENNELRYATSSVISKEDGATFPTTLSIGVPSVVYAYGVRDNTDRARAIFGDLNVPSAETVAQIIVTRNLLGTDVSLTETRAILYNPSMQGMMQEPTQEPAQNTTRSGKKK